jgi:hypothetical protein
MREIVEMAIAEAARVPGCDTQSVNVEIDPVNLM